MKVKFEEKLRKYIYFFQIRKCRKWPESFDFASDVTPRSPLDPNGGLHRETVHVEVGF